MSLNRMSDSFRRQINELQRLTQLQNEFIGNVGKVEVVNAKVLKLLCAADTVYAGSSRARKKSSCGTSRRASAARIGANSRSASSRGRASNSVFSPSTRSSAIT